MHAEVTWVSAAAAAKAAEVAAEKAARAERGERNAALVGSGLGSLGVAVANTTTATAKRAPARGASSLPPRPPRRDLAGGERRVGAAMGARVDKGTAETSGDPGSGAGGAADVGNRTASAAAGDSNSGAGGWSPPSGTYQIRGRTATDVKKFASLGEFLDSVKKRGEDRRQF